MNANTLLQFLTEALFVLVFVVVLVKALRQPRRVTIDTALLFGLVSLLVVEGWLVALLHIKSVPILSAVSGTLIMALPYLLLRLADDLASVSRLVMRAAALGLAVVALSWFALAAQPLPGWLLLPYVGYFVGFTLYGAAVVVRAAAQAGGVTRRRLQAVSIGSLCLGLAILLAGVQVALPAWAALWTMLADLCALASGLGYYIGFVPPTWLRQAWQGPELRAFLGRAARLSQLPDTCAIVDELTRGAAASIGAPMAVICLWDAEAGMLRGDVAGRPYAVRPGESVGGRAFAAQRALFSVDAALDAPGQPDGSPAEVATALLAAPITAGEKRLGALVVALSQAPLFAEDDLVLLQLLADQAAVILENRALVDAMVRASRVKSEFLATMSHELRTPLNAIIGFSEVLYDGTFGSLNDRQQRYVGNVLEAGRHLLGLVNDILDLSKVEAGHMELHREDVELHEVLADSHRVMLPLARQKEIDLRLELAAQALPHRNGGSAALEGQPISRHIHVDRARFLQILYNLLSNALKFTPAGGTVTISATLLPGSVAISVTDTGIGIAAEDQARIFEAFQQVDSSEARKHQGTGLGLALTRHLVELHGGMIALQSTPGQGSTFTVTVPCREPAGSAAVAHGERGTVLVVEDQAAARELLGLYLTEAGYGVDWVDRADAVLARARELQPAAISLDLLLGSEMGWSVLRQLKADAETCNIPVLIVSIVDEQATGFALGAAAYLVKPVARQDLLDALGRVVRGNGRPAHVLAVDDEPEALELIALALAESPYTLTRASSGGEALRLLETNPPDVLILDLMMAPMSGFDLIGRLAVGELTADIPIIVLSARDLTAADMARLNGHVAAALPKAGLRKAQLLGELQRALQTEKAGGMRHAAG